MAAGSAARHDRAMATAAGDGPDTSSLPDGDRPGGASVPPAANATYRPAPPPRSNRFFNWIRGLSILRTRGWIGGVCAGIGTRLGIDPILVRGIVVVVAVLGGPVVLLYAAAWLLLPDEHDVIHAEELARGRFSPAIAGIGALALLSLLPLTQGFWYAGAQYWGEPNAGASIGRLLWTALLLTGLVLFVLWVARRASGQTGPATAAAGEPQYPSEHPSGTVPPATVAFAATTAPDAPAAGPVPPAAFTPEPPKPGADASAEELAAWRRQQDDWRNQRAAWAAEQKRTDRELAAQVAREKARRNAEEAIERARIRRLSNPRISGAYVVLTLGLALVAGAAAALLWPTDAGGYDATVGWAAAVFVLGAAIAIAGALRRRSGFLTFLSIVSLLILLATTAVPSGRQFLWPGSSYGIDTTVSGQYAQPAGHIELIVWDDGTTEPADIDIWQGNGSVSIMVEPGQTVRVDAATDGHDVQLFTRTADGGETLVGDPEYRSEDEGRYASTTTLGAGEPDVRVTLWQGNGSVMITELPE
jgi:phage shock protein PspC (stress-responsive transcriptional regulator)